MTTEVTNMVAIDAFSGVPQSVLDSFEALNQKIMALNLSIPILNLNLGAVSGLSFILAGISALLNGDVTTALTNFGILIGFEGSVGSALESFNRKLSTEGSTTSLLQILGLIAQYLSGEFTTALTEIDTAIKGTYQPTYTAFERVLYSGPNSIFNALGEILGVIENITAAMGNQISKIRGGLVPAFVFLSTKTGIVVGALESVATAAAGVASEMNSAATGVYGLIAALEALSAVDGGIPLPGMTKPPFRADGGPVIARKPYIVGERGPELFIPKRSGAILSHDEAFGRSRSGNQPKIYIEIHDIYGDANLEARIRRGVLQGMREAEHHGLA